MDKEKVLFSVIIVNYNNCDLLEQCINSVKKYTQEVNYEIIVVDNASTECKVSNVTKKFEDVILIENAKNLGFAAANNIGVKKANGKYLVFVNNDVLFIENTLKIIWDYLRKNNKEVILGCKLLNPDLTHQISYSQFEDLGHLIGISFFLYKLFPKSAFFNKYFLDFSEDKVEYSVDIIKGAFFVISKEAFNKLSGFDESFFFFGEESDLCYRFKKKIGEVVYYPKTAVIHIGGATATKANFFKYKLAAIARLKFYWKHYPFLKRNIFYFLHLIGVLNRTIINFVLAFVTFDSLKFKKAKYYFLLLFVKHNSKI